MDMHEQHIGKCKICWNAAITEALKIVEGDNQHMEPEDVERTANKLRGLKVN